MYVGLYTCMAMIGILSVCMFIGVVCIDENTCTMQLDENFEPAWFDELSEIIGWLASHKGSLS